MGIGDNIMAAGMARGAHARGKRVAFGDRMRILWDHNSEPVFRNNPNVAKPGNEGGKNLEWIGYYKGSRIYNKLDERRGRWIWNYDFRPTPGEFYFDASERVAGQKHGKGFVVMEPNVEDWKSVAPNKDWGRAKYQAVCDALRAAGYFVYQFNYPKSGVALNGATQIGSNSFRHAAAILANAALYLGAEGGLHHAAAALDVKAVVLFGGFVPPKVTGYPQHVNLTGGAEACGRLGPCAHCRAAMAAISVEEVTGAALEQLRGAA